MVKQIWISTAFWSALGALAASVLGCHASGAATSASTSASSGGLGGGETASGTSGPGTSAASGTGGAGTSAVSGSGGAATSAVSVGSGGGSACGAGQTACGDNCVDLSTDATHCGACAIACSTGQTCAAGTCQCLTGLTKCGAACVDTSSDAANCGACGMACAASQVCSAGKCASSCGAGETPCDQSCVDTNTSAENCGACGAACPAGQDCRAGHCSCTGTLVSCSGQCVDTTTSNSNCGGCGAACSGGRTCKAGACECPAGQSLCGTSCVNEQTDAANCGACGHACGAGLSCVAGACVTPTCQPATCGTHKWACWPMPNPASSGLPNPASYTDLGNGAVRDNVTCLVWEKAPNTTQGFWQDNSDHCASLASSSFAGYNDWRLPTRVEMASIVDFTRSGDAINTTMFPKEPSGYYRTGSDWYETITGQNASGFSWIYGMSSGFTSNAYAKTTSKAYVRCVHGNGTGEAQGTFAVIPPNQYTINAGEVTDNYTGLIWQQTDSATPAGAAVMPWSGAASYCSSLKLNGHTWRVPSINELATLVDEARVAPAINKTAFPNTKYGSKSNNWYWASTTYAAGSTFGWAINFDDGFTGYNSGASGAWNYFTGAWVRCVR